MCVQKETCQWWVETDTPSQAGREAQAASQTDTPPWSDT